MSKTKCLSSGNNAEREYEHEVNKQEQSGRRGERNRERKNHEIESYLGKTQGLTCTRESVVNESTGKWKQHIRCGMYVMPIEQKEERGRTHIYKKYGKIFA